MNPPTYSQQASRVDIGKVLDDGAWTALRKLAVLLAAFAIIPDGFETDDWSKAFS